MARPRSTDIVKTEKLTVKDYIASNFGGTSGIRDTIVTVKENKLYVGAPLYNSTLYSGSIGEFSVPFSTSYRNTGYFVFELDSNKSIIIQKQNTTISFFEFVSGGTPTSISTVSTLAANAEVYLEAIFCSTEKASTTGYVKYAFLNLPGEAWVVAYNTRIGTWQIEKVNNTYSVWAGTTAYSLGNRRIPTVANGYYYEVTVAGTSAVGEPVWPTTIGNTVTDGTVTWICRGRYNNFPTTTSSSVKTLNGYIFVCVNGDIYNSDLDLPDSWNTSDFISTEVYPDDIVALAKYKNYLVAFGENTIEFFYDAANTSGTPLARQEGILHNIGCVGQGMVTDNEDKIFWISQTSSQNYSIWTLEKFEAKKVSSPEQDGALSKQLSVNTRTAPNTINYMYLFGFRLNGRYMLGIPNFYFDIPPSYVSNILILDFELESYYMWTLTNSNSQLYFGKPFTYSSYFCWPTYLTNSTNISISALSVTDYDYATDTLTLGALFPNTPRIYTKKIDCATTNYKSFSELSINYFKYTNTALNLVVNVWRDRNYLSTITSGSSLGTSFDLSPFKVTRLGRAREIYFYFDTTVEISDLTLKYTEHSN